MDRFSSHSYNFADLLNSSEGVLQDPSSEIQELAEQACRLAAAIKTASHVLEGLKNCIRTKTSGQVTNIQTSNGSVSVVRPSSQWNLRKGRSIEEVRSVLGDRTSCYFSITSTMRPRKDITEALSSASETEKFEVMRFLDQKESKPRVGFKTD